MKSKIIQFVKYIRQFGIKITILQYLPWHFKIDTKMSRWLFACKHKSIDRYLYKKYKNVIEKYNSIDRIDETIKENSPIWIMWWQGHKNSPEIVKKCIESVKENSESHEVILLDENNILEYIDIPEVIRTKYEKGIMKMAAFSDFIRFSLLYKYGGIWCDATIFMTKAFDKSIYDCKFYGIHMNPEKAMYMHCTEAKWSAFLIGASKQGSVVSFCRELFLKYWEEHNQLIDYFLIDYTIRLAYNHVNSIKKIIDEIPFNNNYCSDLLPILGTEYNPRIWDEMSDTFCFKLSWKEQDLFGITEKDTYYKKIVLREDKVR